MITICDKPKLKKIKSFGIIVIFLVFAVFFSNFFVNSVSAESVDDIPQQEIEEYINKYMNKGKIPGLAVSVISGDDERYFCFGTSDSARKNYVTKSTKFELGSNTKAFTALGILKLEADGKINVNDNLSHYYADIKFYYKGIPQEITIEQLLHHTSGIPYKTIAKIREDSSDNAIDNLINDLNGTKLNKRPGEKYEYATVNYDILGGIIQKASGKSYDEYIKENIYVPLGFNDTFFINESDLYSDISEGFLVNWIKQRSIETSLYLGNNPAGYCLSSLDNMTQWIKIQNGIYPDCDFDFGLIEKSHIANRTVEADNYGNSYAAGWETYQKGLGGEYRHGGTNQSFSSYIVFRPNTQTGVVVLCNTNSSYTSTIANGIMDIISGEVPSDKIQSDTNIIIDNISVIIIISSMAVVIFFITLLLRKKRKYSNGKHSSNKKNVEYMSLLLIMLIMIVAAVYYLPTVFMGGVDWKFVFEWTPPSLKTALVSTIILIIICFASIIVSLITDVSDRFKLVSLLCLSSLSGAGNAIIIFVINYAIYIDNTEKLKTVIYFLLGIFLYVGGQRIIRNKLISVTNDIIFCKRINIIKKYLGTSYENIEKLGKAKIQAALNNDAEIVSNFANTFVSTITGAVTLIFCFIYLYFCNKYALLFAILIILIIAFIYFIFSRSANKINESARDLQNIYYKSIEDLLAGIKELIINSKKGEMFVEKMEKICGQYKHKKTESSKVFANLFVVGELLFTVAIACITFIIPFIVTNLKETELAGYVFVLLYMTGPINIILDSIPNIMNIKICWHRIDELLNVLGNQLEARDNNVISVEDNSVNLKFENLEFQYSGSDENSFRIGPINEMFRSGEIIFITGGNGSGKSTFCKVITGLYKPTSGKILLNNSELNPYMLRLKYAAIFSDFHLFENLFGIDCKKNNVQIDKYLKMLELSDKVSVIDGKFTTTELSTGQKKRLALLVSFLEDKKIYMFDEWAADQDPVFRRFFYENILMELKRKGKCIIVVTHDDKYFKLADKHYKFEYGVLTRLNKSGE